MAEPNKSPSQPSPRLKEVGGYEILSKLGQGGMGAVFKARQKSLDRTVALKILPPTIAKDKVFIERFQREARATAKLNHPNIVQGIDVGKDDASGLWYFAMEYVEGPSLQKMLKDQKVIPEKRALEIARDIAQALECASHNGFVHRDIKPDNILLTQRGEAKLADLGLAKQISDDASLTQSGQSVGTPHYMAPEQARGAMNEIDIRTDIYALGGTLFHLVTGRTPFAGSSGDTSAVIMTRHLTEPVPKAKGVNPEISDACSKLISRMLQKKREQRVQTPAALIEQIDEILNGDAPASEVVARHSRQDTTGPRTPVGRNTPVQGAKQSPVPMVVAGLIAVAILGIVPVTRS
jgi:eukaryotic-like serine/threonine-protein kinase